MDEKQQIIAAGKRLIHEGYTTHTWGNISLRGADGRIYLTPSSMDYDLITKEDVAVLDLEGNLLEGARKPSIEKDLHLEIYRRRPEAGAIVHTHPMESLAFACMGEEIPLITDAAVMTLRDTVRTAPYGLPGSKELAANCADTLGNEAMAVLLANHGAVCLGADLEAAFKTAKVLELTAELCRKIRSMGAEPEPLPEKVQKALLSM
ncbi:MAG: class II aldolase/adducin family protein [Lachnospiraceae bacterium]|nr:class II aldolase/adducin family protein [Lachnospiraceae bacterium]